MVQCHNKEEDYCACVNPLTGEEAKDTRTGSGKITARCGNCHLDVSRRVATKSGLRATIDDKRIPQCNSNNGILFFIAVFITVVEFGYAFLQIFNLISRSNEFFVVKRVAKNVHINRTELSCLSRFF